MMTKNGTISSLIMKSARIVLSIGSVRLYSALGGLSFQSLQEDPGDLEEDPGEVLQVGRHQDRPLL
jgi:hypothetical protein